MEDFKGKATTIKRIGPLSLGKILGSIYGFLGLIFGALFSCFSVIGAAAAFSESGSDALGLLFGVGSIIILPIFYAVVGFVGGIIVGAIYNFIAGYVGGIEVTLD